MAHRLGAFSFAAFLTTHMRHRWAEADRVSLVRAHRCADDLAALAALDAEVEASTFADGLRVGSRRNGIALLTTHVRMGTAAAAGYRAMIHAGEAHGHLPVVQGMLWRSLGLDATAAVAVSGYQAAASLATAAIRLGLIGAIEAQIQIAGVLDLIDVASAAPVADDEPIRSFAPLAEIAVCLHGATGQRLFSN
jgi:urease accessory protein